MNARIGDFIAKSDFRTPYQANGLFFFGGLLARGLKNRFGEDFGTDLSIDMGEMLMVSAGFILMLMFFGGLPPNGFRKNPNWVQPDPKIASKPMSK